MKRNIIFLLFISIVLAGCASKEVVKKDESRKTEKVSTPPEKRVVNSDTRERELIKNNRIKSVEKIKFIYDKSGKPVRENRISSTTYDKNGFAMRAVFYDNKDKVKNSYVYKYDKEGKRIETQQLDERNNPSDKFTYEYDKEGNKIKSTRYNSQGELENYYTYKYDYENNLLEENWFSPSGKREYRIEYTYSNGKRVESNTFDETGKQLFRYVYKYDDNGNIVEEIQLDGSKALSVVQYVYKY